MARGDSCDRLVAVNPPDGPSWQERLEAETQPEPAREELFLLTVPGLTILAHPDTRRIGERAPLLELTSGGEVHLSRLEPLFSPPAGGARRELAEPHLSRRPLLFLPVSGGVVRLLRGGSPTPVLIGDEALGGERTFTAEELATGIVLLLAQRVALLLHRFQPLPDPTLPSFGLVGESDALREVRRQIRQVSDLTVPVLLRGETGTGKELVARAIHNASSRRDRPYLAINMGAVPAALAAVELFGAAKGAFTGSDLRRRGFFSLAHGGTLFLDEIGEVPPEVQPLLLRALENGEIQPVGAEETVRVDIRAIAATDSDLEAKIASGQFRAPLLHRLSGYEIRVPPLRNRRDDIGRLFLHFLRQELALIGEEDRLAAPGPDRESWFPSAFMARLALCPWPGNIRQLRNVARHLVVDSRGCAQAQVRPQLEMLLAAPGEWYKPSPKRVSSGDVSKRYRSPMDVSDLELLAALRANRWHLTATARELGVSRSALYLRIDACPQARKASSLDRAEIERAASRCGGAVAAMAEILEVSQEGLKRRMRQLGLPSPLS